MGYRADQFVILNDGTAAHTLDDAAGGLQKPGVGDPKHQVAGVGPGIDLQDLHRIFLRLGAGYGAKNGRFPGLGGRRRKRFAPDAVRGAKEPLGGIFVSEPMGVGSARAPTSCPGSPARQRRSCLPMSALCTAG